MYWEIIADRLSKAGWSWGCVLAVDREWRTIWIVGAHRDDGKRYVVRADESGPRSWNSSQRFVRNRAIVAAVAPPMRPPTCPAILMPGRSESPKPTSRAIQTKARRRF